MAKAIISNENYKTEVELDSYRIVADEPEDVGGKNAGPKPTELLDGALASCTAITIKMYADRKEWNLGELSVEVNRNKNDDGKTSFEVQLTSTAELSDDQKERILKIADKCPVHILLSQNDMKTEWA